MESLHNQKNGSPGQKIHSRGRADFAIFSQDYESVSPHEITQIDHFLTEDSEIPQAGWGSNYGEVFQGPSLFENHSYLLASYPYPPEAYEQAAAAAWPDTSAEDQSISASNKPAENPDATNIPEETDSANTVVVGQAKARKTSPDEDFECKNSCAGNLAGLHKCFRNGLSLIVKCGIKKCGCVFKNKHDFNRHFATIHADASKNVAIKLFDCPVSGCLRVGNRGFRRRDNMLQHRRGVHGEVIKKVKYRFGMGQLGRERK